MAEQSGLKKKGVSPVVPATKGDEKGPVRASSVPDGRRPVLIVEPEGRISRDPNPRPDRRRRDPLLEPEVVAARARTETIKNLGHQLVTLSGLIDDYTGEADRALCEAARQETLEGVKEQVDRARRALGWLECTGRDLQWLAGKHAVGMASIELPALIRDAVKRAYHGSPGVCFRLPEISQRLAITAHPQHLLDALTLAVTFVLDRINGKGDLEVTLAEGRYFVQIKVVGRMKGNTPPGELPRPEDPARLRHLVVGLHQGTLNSSTGEQGEPTITIGLPLRSFHAE